MFVFARKQDVSENICDCPGSRPKTDRGIILPHSVFIIWVNARKDNFNEFVANEKCINRNVLTKRQAANREMLVNNSKILKTPLAFSELIRSKRKNTKKERSE